MAMPLLAAIELVNRKPINVMVTNPAICQVADLAIVLVVVSIAVLLFSDRVWGVANSETQVWTFCTFAA